MITLFESFSNKINIAQYITKSGDTFTIPSLGFDRFGEWYIQNINTQYNRPIQYDTLMRFYLYMKLLRYNGDDPIIKSYVDGLKNNDPKKFEIINKIPNNNVVMGTINKKFNFNYPKHNYDNLQDLKKLIEKNAEVLSDANLKEYIDIVSDLSSKAERSERIVKGMLNMLFGKYYEITHADLSDDLKGMDLWKINKDTGVRQSIQVKNITGNVTFKQKDKIIYINNTSLDLHNFNSFRDKLPYEYLCFYLEYEKKMCIIKSTAIHAINIHGKTIKITLKDWAVDPESKYSKYGIRYMDIPVKFLGKDVTKIFY